MFSPEKGAMEGKKKTISSKTEKIVSVKRASTSSLRLKEAETRINRWILQEDKILI